MLDTEIRPVSVALMPDEMVEIIRLLRLEYQQSVARGSWVRTAFYDRLLEKLGAGVAPPA